LLGPQRFAGSTKAIIGFRQRGQHQARPPVGRSLTQQPAHQVQLVPARHDHNDGSPGQQSSHDIPAKPIDQSSPNRFTFSFLPILERIVDDNDVGVPSSNRPSSTDSVNGSAGRRLKMVSR
jgi:hypothetical protein